MKCQNLFSVKNVSMLSAENLHRVLSIKYYICPVYWNSRPEHHCGLDQNHSLTLLLLNRTCHAVLANSVNPDQLASEEAN